MSDGTLTIDLNFLRELADDGIFLRLRLNQPAYVQRLAGKVIAAGRAIKLAERSLKLLELRDDDTAAANNEMAMAKNGSAKSFHLGRNNVLRRQARNRENFAMAYLLAVAHAEIVAC